MPFSKDAQPGIVISTKKNVYTIACPSGEVYQVKNPGGRIATEHFSIMTNAIPTDVVFEDRKVQEIDEESGEPVWETHEDGSYKIDDEGDPIPKMIKIKVPKLSPGDLDRIAEAFKVWAPTILPKVVKKCYSTPEETNGMAIYDDMPGEDQYGIFMALFNKMNIDKEVFRFVDDSEIIGPGSDIPEST